MSEAMELKTRFMPSNPLEIQQSPILVVSFQFFIV